MLARLSAFVIWGLVAASVVFWSLRLLVLAPAAPAYAVAVGDSGAVRGDLARLLGVAPVAPVAAVASPEAASRFRLLGIVAPKPVGGGAPPVGEGVALIAVDGKMPRAFAVGTHLDTDLVLQSVSLRTASISSKPGAPGITLELPPLAPAATGALAPISMGGAQSSSTAPAYGQPPAMSAPQLAPAAPPQPVPPRSDVPAAPTQ